MTVNKLSISLDSNLADAVRGASSSSPRLIWSDRLSTGTRRPGGGLGDLAPEQKKMDEREHRCDDESI